jgi:hypothetical protein
MPVISFQIQGNVILSLCPTASLSIIRTQHPNDRSEITEGDKLLPATVTTLQGAGLWLEDHARAATPAGELIESLGDLLIYHRSFSRS